MSLDECHSPHVPQALPRVARVGCQGSRACRYWPQVQEGVMGSDHGVVVCRLCQRHGKNNNFAGEGYRCERLLVC